jgi:hypothetical protein
MSALATRSPATRHPDLQWRPRRVDADRGPTLDDVIARAWEVLGTALPAACPVCGGELTPRPAANGALVGGRCDSCGATLS